MDITYQNGLPEKYFDAAVELYESAFGEKFSHAIPNRADRISLIRNGFQAEFAITAFADKQLVGLAGYHTRSGSLTGGISESAILKKLGLLRGIKACVILSLYERTPAPGQLVMDGIVVLSTYRGYGIGTELLKRLVVYASKDGYNMIRLDVINTNPSARKLYERFGFKVIREESYPYLNRILGFGGSATMEYTLNKKYLVLCLTKDGEPDFIFGKVYVAEDDEHTAESGLIRIWDEFDDDGLHSQQHFTRVKVPVEVLSTFIEDVKNH